MTAGHAAGAPVLLVEDDAAIARFVALALKPLPVVLHLATGCAEARRELARREHLLVLCDLTLPDGDGLELIESMLRPQGPAIRPAKVAVFSARMTAATRRRTGELGVWMVLDKPVPLAMLRDCVASALAGAAAGGPGPDNRAPAAVPSPVEPADRHFGGQAALYAAFRKTTLQQLAQDIRDGRAACRDGRRADLARMGHSLGAVLELIGAPAARQAAQALQACASGPADPAAVAAAWSALELELTRLIRS